MVVLDRMVRVFGDLRTRSAHQNEGMSRSRQLHRFPTGQRSVRDAQLRVAARLGHVVALDALRR